MTDPAAPLGDVFRELQRRGFPLGVDEYLLALRALAAGFGGDTRGGLQRVCQALWAHTPAEREEIADVLDVMLPPAEGTYTLVDMLDSTSTAARPSDDDSAAPGTASKKATAPAGKDTIPAPVGPGAAGILSPARPWLLDTRFDLAGSLPVEERQMSRAWRQFRRMSRHGRPEEFDAAATADHLYRRGVLEPVLVPRRGNQARLLILADTGGSMLPFSYFTGKLLDTAGRAGLARVDTRWFHDVADDQVFADPHLAKPVPLDEAARPFIDAGILVYSDAGAARGHLDEARAECTLGMLAALRAVSPNIAWINPVPASRWPGTTAEMIRLRSGVLMQPLDREGLRLTIDRLRGR